MEQLVKELRSPTRVFSRDAEGNETFVDRPPTSKELRAANMITQQAEVIKGMERSFKTMLEEIKRAEETITNLQSQMKQMSDKPKTSDSTDKTN
ncbi:hypothetical protein UFOVP273_88 [uncultured Caudovirales phage]|uniref:Uncharacterized protein n=1 Tax=uncultured Caudovirales phage TaxID=2100421 RepID=A0A6J5LRW5_9CAUD|nr:hypothetical protein UFOVP273_88 [uncultured Caudovirales phage]